MLQACCLAIAVLAVHPAHAQWTLDTELDVVHDNNLGNARSDDSVGDRALLASFSAIQSTYLDGGGSFSWGGRLTGENHSSFSGLNNLALAATLAYRQKMALGPYAPWWRTMWSSAALSYRDRDRNGWLHVADASVGKRFGERWNLGMNLCVEQRTAADRGALVPGFSGDAYSQFSKNFGMNAEYTIDRERVLVLGAQLRNGDVVASSHRYRQLFLASKAIAVDNALGADVFAYRLTGNTLTLNAAMSVLLSEEAHINLSLQRMITRASGDNNYAKNRVSISWLGNF